MTKAIILIPARMASTRLPNKPLADIGGKPMIVHVYERAIEAGIADLVIAADDERVVAAIEEVGGKAIMTKPDHASGSDRIWEALQKVEGDEKYDVIINVQGDLPTIDPEIIKEALIALENDKNADIATLVCKIENEEELTDPNIVKPVISWNDETEKYGKALYFTRCSAPYGEGDLYHHIGLYAYRREALEKFVSLEASPLEIREKLEQLRALENNMKIVVAAVETIPLGVDTEKQLNEAREVLKNL